MTVKDLLSKAAEASDRGDKGIGVFQPSILGATRRKNGDTQIKIALVTNEFTVNDVMDGLRLFLVVATNEQMDKLQQE
jgi:hypothetical protein